MTGTPHFQPKVFTDQWWSVKARNFYCEGSDRAFRNHSNAWSIVLNFNKISFMLSAGSWRVNNHLPSSVLIRVKENHPDSTFRSILQNNLFIWLIHNASASQFISKYEKIYFIFVSLHEGQTFFSGVHSKVRTRSEVDGKTFHNIVPSSKIYLIPQLFTPASP